MSSRVFIEGCEKKGAYIQVSGEVSRYIKKVLRLNIGDSLIICTADGTEYRSVIAGIDKNISVEVLESEKVDRESNLDIILCQALPKGKKMDFIIQKGTELGVKSFIPLISSRSVSRPKESEGKTKRWEKIALEASRQCGRNYIPSIETVTTIEELIDKFSNSDDNKTLKLIPWESQEDNKLGNFMSTPYDKVIILIGPEGGFSTLEVNEARRAGFMSISLGKRILRTETAGIAVVSILQFLWGDMR
ncbi:MAG: 16S rRNA (uracil(1498)-N(3))-methyltransferase [Proteobacteria bacterium]|nr:16S rRNA (uracil(1498)-N(3))-methyltransferase [Pseudomonadota bacterium]